MATKNMQGFHLTPMAIAGMVFLTQPTQADAQTVCLDHRAPGEPVNTVPCEVPSGTTLGRVESTGDGSTILIEGDVTGGVLTNGDNSGVVNNGGGGFFIATTGENSDIVNTSDTFPFRFPDLITFGAESDISNSGSVNEITISGDGSTINNSGNSGNVRLGSQDGLLTNTGDLAFRPFNVINITGTNAQFLNQGTAGFTIVAGDDITIVNSGTLSEIISIPVGQNLRIENTDTITGDIELDNIGTVIENTGTIGGSVTQERSDFVLNNSGDIGGNVTASGSNSHVTNTQTVGSFIVVDGDNSSIFNSGTATQLVSRGDDSSIENEGTVDSIVTFGDDTLITNAGVVNSFITTSGENAGIVNSGTVAQTVSTGSANSDILNTGIIELDVLTFANGSDITNLDTIGGSILAAGDDAVIDNQGSIGASLRSFSDNAQVFNSGTVADQIEIRGVHSRIVNSGSANDILVDSRATGASVQNSGTIAEDIFVEAEGVSVVNSGTIGGAIEITANNASISNSGRATALVTDGSGSTITNTGTVSGLVRADGEGAQFTNSGRAGSFVGTGDNTSIENSGQIDLIGTSGDNARVVNSGSIGSGNTGDGIEFQGSNAYLELRSGTVIEGEIAFQGGGTQTLALGELGEVNFTFDGAPNRIETNGAPFVLSGNRLAVFNTTALSTQDEQLANLVGGISSVLDSRFQTLRSPSVPAVQRTRPAFSFLKPQDEQSGWVDTFGSYRNQDADGQVAENTQWVGGLVAGTDPVDIAGLSAGFFIGGSRGGVDADDVSQSVDSKSYFLGSYASTNWGRSFVDMSLTLGYSEFNQERQAANNTVSGGRETIKANFDGWFVSPAVTIAKPMQIAGTAIEGSFGLQYAGLFLDSYTETGTTSPQTIDSRTVHVGMARLKVAVPKEVTTGNGSILNYRVQAGIDARTNFGGDSIDGVLLGQNINFNTGGDNNTLGGFLNVSGDYQMQNGLIFSAGTEAIFETSGSYQFSGRVGLEFRF